MKDRNGGKIEVGDWLRDMNNKDLPPYIVTKIIDREVYGEIPVDNIYDKKINLSNVYLVNKF